MQEASLGSDCEGSMGPKGLSVRKSLVVELLELERLVKRLPELTDADKADMRERLKWVEDEFFTQVLDVYKREPSFR
jgi:hypothetical protein